MEKIKNIKDVEEKTTNNYESDAVYRLSTMLPFDVFSEFLKFCKKNSKTAYSKWDFGVGLRILLMKAKYADKLEEMESRLTKLEKEDIDG